MAKYPLLKFTGIDLFAGAGGMSLGATWAGIDVVFAVEIDTAAAGTYSQNNPSTKVEVKDIKQIDFSALELETPFIVFGGPPCQGFSYSNKKTRTLSNTNNFLFEEFFEVVKTLKPTWFVLENVEGFNFFDNSQFKITVEERFEKNGYKVKSGLLKACEFGVPQSRKRYFLVGNNSSIDFEWPVSKADFKVTVRQALSDLPSLLNGEKLALSNYKRTRPSQYARLMRVGSKKAMQNFVSISKPHVVERYLHIPPGGNWRNIPINLMGTYKSLEKTHSGIYKRLHPDKPAVVIANYRKNMLIHPFENRGLSTREAARLQSFPDNFEFKGSIRNIQQQIGNAVPPLLAKAVFKAIIEQTP